MRALRSSLDARGRSPDVRSSSLSTVKRRSRGSLPRLHLKHIPATLTSASAISSSSDRPPRPCPVRLTTTKKLRCMAEYRRPTVLHLVSGWRSPSGARGVALARAERGLPWTCINTSADFPNNPCRSTYSLLLPSICDTVFGIAPADTKCEAVRPQVFPSLRESSGVALVADCFVGSRQSR
jgi:hypothetical protein